MTGIAELETGLHFDLPAAAYHVRELGVASKSALDLVHRSPASYRAWLDGLEEEPTTALVFGSAFHCASLEPERFALEYVVAPSFGDCRKKENRAARDAWLAENKGKQPLALEDGERIRAMVAALHAHPLVGAMLRRGRPEVTVRWDDGDVGLPCKARLDLYDEEFGAVLDLKTTEDARPSAFARSIANYRYHVQEAHYRSGMAAVGRPVGPFIFAAIEKAPPHLLAVYELDDSAVMRGTRALARNMRTLADCAARNVWPGYSESIRTIELPRWAED